MKSITSMLLLAMFFFIVMTSAQENANQSQKVLFITSNQATYGDSDKKTANHFGEIVLAYDVFTKAGYEIDIVSPKGGSIPVGYFDDSNTVQRAYYSDSNFMERLEQTLHPTEVTASNYVAVYYSGGGAAMFGVPSNTSIQKISEEIYNNNGILSAVCHGTAGITQLKSSTGDFLFAGKKVSGFPDAFERKDAPYFKTFPFSIEAEIIKHGGDFVYSKKGWDGLFVIDGRIITGQDPTASALVAEQVVLTLKSINN